ncbi:MAG TPA: DUF2939 domain-containing protein [Nitrospinaceae bacterium]|nr:DUF2939 domain-containing protein [Nitrospinaceae bacterium]
MRNIRISIFSLLCVYLLWPYIAVFSLYVSLQTGHVEGVEDRVDWSLFKKNLRLDLDNLVEVKLKESLNKKNTQMNFDSLTLSKQVSDKIATPEGLIYLFNKPDDFVEQIRQILNNTISPEKINPPIPKKKAFEPEGPNFPDLFKRIKYAFFTEPDSFKLSFNEGDLSFTMDWRLQGLFWKLIRLKILTKQIK